MFTVDVKQQCNAMLLNYLVWKNTFYKLTFNLDKMIEVIISQRTLKTIPKVYLCQFGWNQEIDSEDVLGFVIFFT